jgi:hypothetical protein
MALNFTFGGTVVDKNENTIECSYQLFYYRQNVISPVHTTENSQYNINAGEDSHLTLEGELKNGDVVLLKFWSGDQFAIYRYVHSSGDYNIQDIKLLDKQNPTVTLYVNNNTIGKTVVASNSNSDDYQYTYSGTTFYHRASWYGFDLFQDRVGVESVLYNFDNSGFGIENSSSFDSFGEYEIVVKVINKLGLEDQDSKIIKIRKNEPTVSLSNNPVSPYTNENTEINVLISDEDNSIETVEYLVDDVITDVFTHSFETVETHSFEVGIVWNDGFESHFLHEELPINITPRPLSVQLDNTNIDNTYTFETTVELGDGNLESIVYTVYYRLPFTDNFIEVMSQNGSYTQDITFVESGSYRIKVEATDEYGTKASAYNNISLVCSTTECETETFGVPKVYFDKE